MAAIFVSYGGRGQYQRIMLRDDDSYIFRRFHIKQPLKEVADFLLEEAADMGQPPILFDVTQVECHELQRELIERKYPHLVHMAEKDR